MISSEGNGKNLITEYGGRAPVGYGVLPQESRFWEVPNFSKHPLTKREEASGEGLFFRMWPNHVKQLMQMKADGWPHVEIVRVAKELWKRQQEEYGRDEELAQQHKDLAHASQKDAAGMLHSGEEGPPEGGAPPPEGGLPGGLAGMLGQQMMGKGLSMFDGGEYAERLETFRGKFFSKDGTSRYDALVRSGPKRKRTPMRYKTMEAVMSDKGESVNPLTGGFAVMIKGPLSGNRRMLRRERAKENDFNFSSPPDGVTSPPPVDAEAGSGDDLDLEGR